MVTRTEGRRIRSVADARENIKTGKASEKAEGFSWLRRYFDQHRDELLGLGSSSLRLLFDDLFQVNSEEAKTYVRSSGAKITKASSNLRLGEGAAALRSLVASTVNFMPKKQAVAVIEHVTQMLQMDREGFLAPVELDYLRILRTVLEYQAHGEHLGKVAKKDNPSQWQALMSFCLAGLEENHDWSSTTRLQASRASSQRGAISPVCNELLGCLKGLLAATNAPLFNEGDRAVRAVLKVLKDVTSQSNISMSEGFSSGLAIVRFVLSRISSSNSMLVTEVIGDTLLVSSRLLISANRLTAMREEILMIVLILQPHLMNVVARSARADFREQVDALASALFDDYVDDSPSNKQRLDLDDVDLGLRNRISIDAMPLQRSVFTLRPDTREVELYWTQLHMTAFCQGWVDADATTPRRPGGHEEEGRATASDDEFEGRAKNTASKRRRVGTKLESMLDRLKRAGTIERVRILQIICFSLDMCDLSVSSMLDFATQLLDYAVEKDGQVASWAFLCLSFCGANRNAKHASLASLWLSVSRLAMQKIASLSHCRAACHTMNCMIFTGCVPYHNIEQLLDIAVKSPALSGPAVLCDSSLELWLSMASLKAQYQPGSRGMVGYYNMVEWICSKWNPNDITDHRRLVQSRRSGLHVRIASTLNRLLQTQHDDTQYILFPQFDHLGQCWLEQRAHFKVFESLLTLDRLPIDWQEKQLNTLPLSCRVSPKISEQMHLTLMNYLGTEMDRMRSAKSEISGITLPTHRGDAILAIFSACVSITSICGHLNRIPSDRTIAYQEEAVQIASWLVQYACGPQGDQTIREGIVAVLAASLPRLNHKSRESSEDSTTFLRQIGIALVENYQEFVPGSSSSQRANHRDAVDHDFDDDSQRSRVDERSSDIMARSFFEANSSYASKHMSSLHYILFWTMSGPKDSSIPTAFIAYLTHLNSQRLVLCWPLLKYLLEGGYCLQSEDLGSLLEHVSYSFMTSPDPDDSEKSMQYDNVRIYDWERSESALGFCLTMLKGTVSMWLDQDNMTASTLGDAIYDWLHQLTSRYSEVSIMIKADFADLLYSLLEVKPDYIPKDIDVPSIRSSLLNLLREEPSVLVKYEIAKGLPRLFDHCPEDQHKAMLEDIDAVLPNHLQWIEGIALRLFVFTALGYTWKSLLRSCFFYIVDWTSSCPEALPQAQACLRLMSKELGLAQPKDLLDLLKSQLLHTFLIGHPWSEFPHALFEFRTLHDFMLAIRKDAVSILFMRGHEADSHVKLDELLVSIKQSLQASLEECFPSVAAYCMLQDALKRPADTDDSAEQRLQMTLGLEHYGKLLSKQHHFVLGHILLRLDAEEPSTKYFEKYDMGYAITTTDHMKAMMSSGVLVAATQQPSWGVRYLPKIIQHLRSKLHELGVRGFWSSRQLVAVSRMLLSEIKHVLGHGHVINIIRKLRLVIGLAGSAILSGYPLEQLLHGLRPEIINVESNDDAIGIFQYLLDRGKPYLQRRPGFVAGLLTALFLDLLAQSTSREPELLLGRKKAQALHNWLAKYLDTFQASGLKKTTLALFRDLIGNARRMSKHTNAILRTPESGTLMALLKDQEDETSLLGRRARTTSYRLFSKLFREPHSFREDMLGTDVRATNYAVRLWRASQLIDDNEEFLVWTGKVLGRSFLRTGTVPKDLVEESDVKQLLNLSGHTEDSIGSKAAIVLAMTDLLHSDKSNTVGKLEIALQACLVEHDDTEELGLMEQRLSLELVETFSIPRKSQETEHNADQDLLLGEIPETLASSTLTIQDVFERLEQMDTKDWIRELVTTLAASVETEPVLRILPFLLRSSPGLARRIFPFVLHLCLDQAQMSKSTLRTDLSMHINACLSRCQELPLGHLSSLINAILYLRTQKLDEETSTFKWNFWLDIDYAAAARAAAYCKMHKTALLLYEVARTIENESGSSEARPTPRNDDMLLLVYKAIDEPDSFYGIHEVNSIASVGDRLAYEGNVIQSLLFRGAQLDGLSRRDAQSDESTRAQLISAMGAANLNTIIQDLITDVGSRDASVGPDNNMYIAALQLNRWDVAVPADIKAPIAVLYRALQGVANARQLDDARFAVRAGLLDISADLRKSITVESTISDALSSLASLNEIDDLLASSGAEQLQAVVSMMEKREDWMITGRTRDVASILRSRKAVSRILVQNQSLQTALKHEPVTMRLHELKTLIQASNINRKLGSLEDSLADVTFLAGVANDCTLSGLVVDGAVKLEIAHALSARGELGASISILRRLDAAGAYDKQALDLSRAEVLATLGHRVSEARLEKPDIIIKQYFEPALLASRKESGGAASGSALHIYATFCHDQLDNPEVIEELRRAEKLHATKVAELQALGPSQNSQAAQALAVWRDIYAKDLQRLQSDRETFIRKSLNCYLECLATTDKHDIDVVRFTSLWLQHSDNEDATVEIRDRIDRVPSRKFATLMHQLASRLQRDAGTFQQVLKRLVEKICTEHPYHSMNHVYASYQNANSKDSQTQSRQAAATEIVSRLASGAKTSDLWARLSKSNTYYTNLANHKPDKNDPNAAHVRNNIYRYRENCKIVLDKVTWSRRMKRDVPSCKLPPITMSVMINMRSDYSNVPVITQFEDTMSILGGVSAPKLLSERLSNGLMHKELFKGGSDDLRQDSIMEQVFAEVTALLRKNKATQQRDLRIRTYNVVPLDATTGAVEFVQNTDPLMPILSSAHELYHPDELKWSTVRKYVVDAKANGASNEKRVKVFRDAIKRFTPVFRHIFLERYHEPDVWFARQTNYTRSTAANSILGHIIGLGDRHNANILLDKVTGEIVHIDIGVCFEAGRILPIPETVPFRLTRDIIDGFGVLGTEGVFRRCCEFMLGALRENKDTIMTLLNVLRYDPLHNWTVSPLRAVRLQKEQATADSTPAPTPVPVRNSGRRSLGAVAKVPAAVVIPSSDVEIGAARGNANEDEGGEADRALRVVEKKLGKLLSVQAAVNELIQQATDETNLALLFGGWAAWA